VFHADGTGTVNDRSISVTVPPFSAGSDEVSLQFTYTIGPDGKLSIALVPGTYKATNLTGPAAGLTAVEEIPVLTGFIGEGARTSCWARLRRPSNSRPFPMASSSPRSALARAP
jgi:hypothetical protein